MYKETPKLLFIKVIVFTIVTLHGRKNASFLEKQGKFGKKQILEKSKVRKKSKFGKRTVWRGYVGFGQLNLKDEICARQVKKLSQASKFCKLSKG